MPRTSRRNYRSKSLRNLKSAAHGIARSTSRIAASGAEKTLKWMATNHSADFHRRQSSIFGAINNIHFHQAYGRFIVRKMKMGNIRVGKLINSSNEPFLAVFLGYWIDVAYGWLVNHLLFVWDLLWGFTESVLSMLFMSLFRVALIIFFNVIFFGAIYLLLTA